MKVERNRNTMADNQTQIKEIEQLLEEYKKGMTPEQSHEVGPNATHRTALSND